MTQAAELAQVFGQVAQRYERWRPSYPGEVIDWVAERCPGKSALEVGAGTGKATRSFVERGFHVVASDPDSAMVDVGRSRVPRARWVVADALEVTIESDLDLVYGAQVWHWLPNRADPVLAAKLRPCGVMAWIWNLPDIEEDSGLFGDLYGRFLPDAEAASRRRHRRRDSQMWRNRLAEATGEVEVLEHHWSQPMTAEQYVGMSGTFSDHVALPHDRRRALMEAIAERINSLGGVIDLSYVTRVFLGYRGGQESGSTRNDRGPLPEERPSRRS